MHKVTAYDKQYWGHLVRCLEYIPDNTDTILEFGVFMGGSIGVLKEATPSHIKLFGFDTFTGLPENWRSSNALIAESGKFSTGGRLPEILNVRFFKGVFSQSIPRYLEQYPDNRIGMIHVDCDLYSSTIDVLYGLNSEITPGTILVFDEWSFNYADTIVRHEEEAFNDWVIKFNRDYEVLNNLEARTENHIVRITR